MSDKKDLPRCNGDIKVSEVRLIDEAGEMLGVVNIREAMQKAYNAGMDLIEISPNAQPPVCKIMDMGKYLYEKQKKQKNAQPSKKMKEIKFKVAISEHDLSIKIKHAVDFLKSKHPLRVEVLVVGRIANRDEMAQELLQKFLAQVGEGCKCTVSPIKRAARAYQVNISHV